MLKKLIIYPFCTLIVLILTLYAILTITVVMTDILPGNCNYILDFLLEAL